MSEANLRAVQEEVVEVRLVLHFVPQSDPLWLPGEDNQAISFILRLHHTSDTGGVLQVALVKLYLLQDENTRLNPH